MKLKDIILHIKQAKKFGHIRLDWFRLPARSYSFIHFFLMENGIHPGIQDVKGKATIGIQGLCAICREQNINSWNTMGQIRKNTLKLLR